MLPLEKQVTSLPLSKKLKELWVKQESLFYWYEILNDSYEQYKDFNHNERRSFYKLCQEGDTNYEEKYSAYTSAELGEMLIKLGMKNMPHFFNKPKKVWAYYFIEAETEADARAEMLIYLIENKILGVDEIK